jgi:hypothetical protein
MSEPSLDWGTAAVADGELVVSVNGELPSGWKRAFEATAKLLGHGEWQAVKLKKQRLRVGGVSPGDEDRLRHFLESVIQQTNADRAEEEDEPDEDERAEDEETGDDAPGTDSEMTERFRSFARS